MADWLGYGLEDALSDSPEIAVVRKNKLHSGLVRYEAKSDLDWWRVARDILAQEKANYVVMMMGVSDRQSIRERDLAKDAEKKKGKDQAEKPAAEKEARTRSSPTIRNKPPLRSLKLQPAKKTGGTVEFRTDQWAEIYSKRIDETIAAMKSKGVPVLWVGLPSIRGAKSTADEVYLNDLYRARAEKAGIVYIDIWDGFVDESGKYSNFGPDYEGQMRRLRSADGVFFTKAGALKLAHYVEREIRRHMNSRAIPVALPMGPLTPATPDGKPACAPRRRSGGAAHCDARRIQMNCSAVPANSSPHAMPLQRVFLSRASRCPRRPAAPTISCFNAATTSLCLPAAAIPSGAVASAPAEPLRICPAEQKPAASQSNGKSTQSNPGRRPPRRRTKGPSRSRSRSALSVAMTCRGRQGAFSPRVEARSDFSAFDQRGSVVVPIRNLSTACAAWRPSRIAHTTSDCPRRISPAANTFGIEV